jgi:hypothetical protein
MDITTHLIAGRMGCASQLASGLEQVKMSEYLIFREMKLALERKALARLE